MSSKINFDASSTTQPNLLSCNFTPDEIQKTVKATNHRKSALKLLIVFAHIADTKLISEIKRNQGTSYIERLHAIIIFIHFTCIYKIKGIRPHSQNASLKNNRRKTLLDTNNSPKTKYILDKETLTG